MSRFSDNGITIWSFSSVNWTKTLLLFTFNLLRFCRSLCNTGSSLTLSFARICSLFKIISFTRLIAWSSSWCCLMLTVFNFCLDWWRTWSSCSFNKVLFAFTAQSHASVSLFHRSLLKLLHSCRFLYIF